jgi:hypothetical protein
MDVDSAVCGGRGGEAVWRRRCSPYTGIATVGIDQAKHQEEIPWKR